MGLKSLRFGALLKSLLACDVVEGWRWEKEGDGTGFGAGGEEKVGS